MRAGREGLSGGWRRCPHALSEYSPPAQLLGCRRLPRVAGDCQPCSLLTNSSSSGTACKPLPVGLPRAPESSGRKYTAAGPATSRAVASAYLAGREGGGMKGQQESASGSQVRRAANSALGHMGTQPRTSAGGNLPRPQRLPWCGQAATGPRRVAPQMPHDRHHVAHATPHSKQSASQGAGEVAVGQQRDEAQLLSGGQQAVGRAGGSSRGGVHCLPCLAGQPPAAAWIPTHWHPSFPPASIQLAKRGVSPTGSD